MKIGVCIDWENPERLLTAKTAGADFVEFKFNSFQHVKKQDVKSLAKLLNDNGLSVLSMNGFFPWDGTRVVGERADKKALVTYMEDILDKTDVLGAKFQVFGSAGARKIEEGQKKGKVQAEIVDFLGEYVAPCMKNHDRICVIEPLSECNVINTVMDAVSFAEAVDSPYVNV
ncbi:MAG: sugar phosphate isomerase/epimerase, partial [Clostridia bacterium]|nr:sugar phosphate isomerase/epimerase [Clostridia bacterium]